MKLLVALALVSSMHEQRASRVVVAPAKEAYMLNSGMECVHTTTTAPNDEGNDTQLAQALMHRSSEIPVIADAGGVSSSSLLDRAVSGKAKSKEVCCGKFTRLVGSETELVIESVKVKKDKCHRWWWEGVAAALTFETHNQNLNKAVMLGYSQFDCCKGIKDRNPHSVSMCNNRPPAITKPEGVSDVAIEDGAFEFWMVAASNLLSGRVSELTTSTPGLVVKTGWEEQYQKHISPKLLRIERHISQTIAKEGLSDGATVPQEFVKRNEVSLDWTKDLPQLTEQQKAVALLQTWRDCVRMEKHEVLLWSKELDSRFRKLGISMK